MGKNSAFIYIIHTTHLLAFWHSSPNILHRKFGELAMNYEYAQKKILILRKQTARVGCTYFCSGGGAGCWKSGGGWRTRAPASGTRPNWAATMAGGRLRSYRRPTTLSGFRPRRRRRCHSPYYEVFSRFFILGWKLKRWECNALDVECRNYLRLENLLSPGISMGSGDISVVAFTVYHSTYI